MKKKILIATVVIALTSIITSSGVAANNYIDNGSDADTSSDTETYTDLSENEDPIDTICDAADILGGSYETAEEAETETFVETTSDSAIMKETAITTNEATESIESVDETIQEEDTELAESAETESEKIEETTGTAETEENEKIVETTAETKKVEETTTAETTTISTTTAETTAETVEETTASSSALPSSLDIVQPLGNVNMDIVTGANKELELVPEFLLDAFVENGWEYYVSEEDLATKFWKGTYAYGTVLGDANLEADKLYLDNRTEAIECTLHEFGHFVDKYYKYPSQTDEFATIYKSERSTFMSVFNYSHSSINQYELFAQSFLAYLKYPEKLASNCPKLYEFMLQYVIK